VIHPIYSKVKYIVKHFHISTVAAEKLLALWRQMRSEHNLIKLKNDVATRWNSTSDMFCRICEVQEPVDAAIVVLENQWLTSNKWKTLSEVCQVLKPFESITNEVNTKQ